MKNKTPLILSIVLIAMNLRLPITAIPPLLPALEHATGLSNGSAGLLTTIPLLAFAGASPIITKLGNRFGNERVITGFYGLLVIGSLLRSQEGWPMLILGTILIGVGIDSGNVLLPAIIKDRLPMKPALGLSTYLTAMLVVSSLGTGVTGFVVAKTSLHTTLLGLFLITFLSLFGCLLLWHTKATPHTVRKPNRELKASLQSVWRTKLGWLITAFYGLQALIYYSLITWLPAILTHQGYDNITASLLVTVLQVSCLVVSVITPLLATNKRRIQVGLWLILVGLGPTVVSLLLPKPPLAISILVAILMGIGVGLSCSLSILFFALKTKTATETAQISGMAQSFGYLFAAFGPVCFGYLHQFTQSWFTVIALLVLLTIGQWGSGWFIEKQTYIFEK